MPKWENTPAVIGDVPVAIPTAMPWLPASFPIVATVLLKEDQITDGRSSVLPSWNTPVATNLWVAPTEMEALAGAIVMDCSPGGVCILGW